MPHPISPFYRRNRLDAEAQARYDLIIDAVRAHEEHLPEGTSTDDWTAVADHPELFWMTGPLMCADDEWLIQYYDLAPDEIASTQEQIDRAAEMILDLAPADGTDWDKALYVYETLVRLVRYEEDERGIAMSGTDESGVWRNGRDFSRSIPGPLVVHRGICVGIAMTVQYLLQRLGIECLQIQGRARDRRGGHAWDVACLDGEYCLIDATFGRGWSTDQTDRPAYVAHDWFGFSREDFEREGLYKMPELVPLPDHIGSGCDWFRRTGRFVEEFGPALIDDLLGQARADGLSVLELKCASDVVRDQVRSRLEDCHGLTVFPHRMRVLAAPLSPEVRLVSVGADGSVVVP